MGWKAGFVPVAISVALVAGAQSVAAVPTPLREPAPGPSRGASDVLTDLYLGDASKKSVDALLRLALDDAATDDLALGAEDLARAVFRDDEQGSEGGMTGVFAYAVPDLDGDRRDDFMQIRYDLRRGTSLYDGTVAYRAFRGTDGRSLWTATVVVEDGFPLTYSVPLGPRAGTGLVVEVLGLTDAARSYAPRLAFTAFDSDGRKMWERAFEPEATVPGARVEGIPVPPLAEFADVAKGPALDLLFGTATLTGPNMGTVHALTAETSAVIVDGSSGEVFVDPAPETNWSTSPRPGAWEYQGDWIPAPLPAGDVSGDGTGDYFYALAQPQHGGRLSMRSSADGSELWAAEDVPVGVFTAAGYHHDVDGDDVGDLLLTTMLFPPQSDQTLPHGDLLRAISGADGATLWTGRGRYATVPGDVDRDGIDDVATVSSFYAPDERTVGIEFAGFDGADGKPLYTRRHTMPYEPGASAMLVSVHGGAGDLDADRVDDFYFHQTLVQADRDPRSASKMVSGRDGHEVFDGLPWVPLAVSFDGAGDDGLQSAPDPMGKHLVFTVADGRGRGVVWSARYRASGFGGNSAMGAFAPMWSAAGAYSADSCPDLSAVVAGKGGIFLAVLDGRDGSLEWSRRLLGKGDDAFAKPVGLRERAGC